MDPLLYPSHCLPSSSHLPFTTCSFSLTIPPSPSLHHMPPPPVTIPPSPALHHMPLLPSPSLPHHPFTTCPSSPHHPSLTSLHHIHLPSPSLHHMPLPSPSLPHPPFPLPYTTSHCHSISCSDVISSLFIALSFEQRGYRENFVCS